MNRLGGSLRVLLAVLVSLTPPVLAPTVASAATGTTVTAATPPYPPEDDIARSAGGSPPTENCSYGAYGSVGCFKKYGDVWWVYKGRDSQTYVYWENELWNGSSWRPYRSGRCNNQEDDGWATCNKDYYEASSVNYFGNLYNNGAKGSRLRWQICLRQVGPVLDICTPSDISLARWYSNDS